MRSGFSLRPENKKENAEQQCGSLRRAALVTTTYKNNASIRLKSKLRARLLSGLSCGQSRSPARTVFIRDVVYNTKKPMKRFLNTLLILTSTLGYSQSNPELDVFKKVINYEIEKGNSGIYLQCEKSKTVFNLNDFQEQTLLEVPLNILKELEQKAKLSNKGRWNSDLLTDLKFGSDFIKTKTCLSKKDS